MPRGGPDPGAVLAREVPRHPLGRLLRAVMSAGVPDPVAERVLGSGIGQAFARSVFFHTRAPAGHAADDAPYTAGTG